MDIEGVLNEVPDPMAVPPVAELYQYKLPALAVAPKVTVPASQREPGTTETMAGELLIVAVTDTLLFMVQLELEAST